MFSASFFLNILTNKYVLIGITVISLYFYIGHIRNQNNTLRDNQALLESVVDQQKEVIKQLQNDVKEVIKSKEDIRDKKDALEKENSDLKDKLFRETKNKKRLEELAYKKTKLVEKLINSSTEDVLECLEVVSRGGEC